MNPHRRFGDNFTFQFKPCFDVQMVPTREMNPMADQNQMLPSSNGMGRMYRTMSGLSLADQHEALLSNHGGRRNSEQVGAVGGKKSFRSKRFSRNVDREPGSLKRAQSFHMDQRDDSEFWHDNQRRPFNRLALE